ncbi:type II secretion system F family protein [Methanobrevibacter sp.]|uniref:type II secretion system F family protein n=1 Tax=Methanobrevibacter sp. TaxID=66852 RepID=UPI0025CEF71A|nr:type II secretion system F family protein [Methanobrevibacter sp.]MBR4447517.1 type II secretion system F family protein [Methanobrevibacter sp.]
MEFKIIDDLVVFLDNIVPEKYLSKLQEFLLSGAIFTEASKVLAILVIFILVSEIALTLTLTFLNLPVSVLILPFFIFPGLFTYIVVQQERRAQEIEKTAPDFLRQLASMLQVGLSFENAMEDMSQYGEGPLYDEMRRTIIEIRMGRNFDDAWRAMSKRLKSKELERVFGIILDGRKSGSSISNVLSDVSDDLRELLALKRERKSAVMMSVMFLLISAIIATPFAIGMVSVYSGFMQIYGMESEIILAAPIAGELYLVIHSVLVAFIISIIMYGDFKKGIKFSLPLVVVSFAIFYFISNFGGNLLMGGLYG